MLSLLLFILFLFLVIVSPQLGLPPAIAHLLLAYSLLNVFMRMSR